MMAPEFSWVRPLDGWDLFWFAAGTCFLFGYDQQRTLGIIMIALIVVANLKRPRTVFRRLRPAGHIGLRKPSWVEGRKG